MAADPAVVQRIAEEIADAIGLETRLARAIGSNEEVYQQRDGSILLPEILRGYLGRDRIG